ncbi:MAG: ketopantoate reductase family protein [Acidobacteria bacterium]|nr:ketopantoate reductase family protein [Acidobacteriota bacterium]
MKIAIMGSGGVGGYYGARLATSGHDVHFIARGEHARAMRESGLRIESGTGNFAIPRVRVAEDSSEVGAADLVVIAVKLWDTEAAAHAVVPLVGPSTIVVSLQNGVEKDDVIGAIVGREHLIGGVTWIIARILEPGVIAHTGAMQRVVAGELDGTTSERVGRVVDAFSGAGVNAAASDDIRRATWEKFAFLAASAAVTAVTRLSMGPVRNHPATRALLRDAIAETVAVARANGIAIPEAFVDEQMSFVDSLPAAGRASMANDILHGGRLELEWLSGAVIRLGEKAGVPTPVHRTLYAALAPYANGAPEAG